MRLYLIQHGDAVDKSVDPDRPLSETGVRDVEAVGHFLVRLNLAPPEVRHRGKARARQPAERLAHHWGAPHVLVTSGLNPNDRVKPLYDELQKRDQDLVLVGHLPHLSKLASRLLAHDEDAEVVRFQKGGVVCLERDEAGAWHVEWMVVPDLLPQ